MYEDYWKLKEKPFDNNYDLRFLYLSQQHDEALNRLLYTVRDKRHGVVLSGEYGCGKSIILKYSLKRLRDLQEGYQTVLIVEPLMTTAEFYGETLRQLGVQVDRTESRTELAACLRETLIKIHNEGGHTVVAIDEADLVEKSTMQEMRLLLDLCHPETQKSLLTLTLCGRLGLDAEDEGHFSSRALRQRIPICCLIENLAPEQVHEYIQHRLRVAGQHNPLFTADAVQLIAEASDGIPRAVNNISDLGLFLGCSRNSPKVDAEIIDTVIQEISGSLN